MTDWCKKVLSVYSPIAVHSVITGEKLGNHRGYVFAILIVAKSEIESLSVLKDVRYLFANNTLQSLSQTHLALLTEIRRLLADNKARYLICDVTDELICGTLGNCSMSSISDAELSNITKCKLAEFLDLVGEVRPDIFFRLTPCCEQEVRSNNPLLYRDMVYSRNMLYLRNNEIYDFVCSIPSLAGGAVPQFQKLGDGEYILDYMQKVYILKEGKRRHDEGQLGVLLTLDFNYNEYRLTEHYIRSQKYIVSTKTWMEGVGWVVDRGSSSSITICGYKYS